MSSTTSLLSLSSLGLGADGGGGGGGGGWRGSRRGEEDIFNTIFWWQNPLQKLVYGTQPKVQSCLGTPLSEQLSDGHMGRMDQQYVGPGSFPEEGEISLEEIVEFFFPHKLQQWFL